VNWDFIFWGVWWDMRSGFFLRRRRLFSFLPHVWMYTIRMKGLRCFSATRRLWNWDIGGFWLLYDIRIGDEELPTVTLGCDVCTPEIDRKSG